VIREVCVDASVAVKWYVTEEWREQALALLDECSRLGVEMVAPDHFFSEAGNAIWRSAIRGIITGESGIASIVLLAGLNIEPFDVRDLYVDAWRIAETFSRPTLYDAYYLALCEQRGCDLWTADERLVNCVSGLSYVRHIRDFVPGALGG
jgi:predicted nucleic acid-binding protein